jgi:EmrB/QacA subfamily drug resistance transporter
MAAAHASERAGGAGGAGGAGNRKALTLAAMIFAVAMTFIDQTIVSIAVPRIQSELHLSVNGVQWVVNAYLLALAAAFTFGGRLADMIGHRRMVIIGIVTFAGASAACGLTPVGSAAAAWIIAWRVVQGIGGAIMYPAALAIVVSAFPVRERGRAMAIFFGVAGGLTSVGPILGGYLSEWTWRAIFWVNIPVAVIALVLLAIARPVTQNRPGKMDWTGLVLIAGGVGLVVFGLQQTQVWGWADVTTISCMVGGLILLVAFVPAELRVAQPLINVRIFAIRAFLVENIVLFTAMIVFIPIFFFASIYAQVALGDGSQEAGLYLLLFFAGFAPGVQIGGRRLDKQGAKGVVVAGCAIGAAGLALWGSRVTQLSLGTQWYFIVMAGAGLGLMVGPANTDAINQVGRLSYGEATGITQTVRNFGASFGLAALGTLLVTAERTHLAAWRSSGCGPPRPAARRPRSRPAGAAAARRPGSRPRWPGRSSARPSSASGRACAPCSTRWPSSCSSPPSWPPSACGAACTRPPTRTAAAPAPRPGWPGWPASRARSPARARPARGRSARAGRLQGGQLGQGPGRLGAAPGGHQGAQGIGPPQRGRRGQPLADGIEQAGRERVAGAHRVDDLGGRRGGPGEVPVQPQRRRVRAGRDGDAAQPAAPGQLPAERLRVVLPGHLEGAGQLAGLGHAQLDHAGQLDELRDGVRRPPLVSQVDVIQRHRVRAARRDRGQAGPGPGMQLGQRPEDQERRVHRDDLAPVPGGPVLEGGRAADHEGRAAAGRHRDLGQPGRDPVGPADQGGVDAAAGHLGDGGIAQGITADRREVGGAVAEPGQVGDDVERRPADLVTAGQPVPQHLADADREGRRPRHLRDPVFVRTMHILTLSP